MIKVLNTHPAAQAIKKATNRKLRILNISQIMGYVCTGMALGFGIPTLNIYLTRKSEAKRKARAEEMAKQEALKVDVKSVKPETKAVAA